MLTLINEVFPNFEVFIKTVAPTTPFGRREREEQIDKETGTS